MSEFLNKYLCHDVEVNVNIKCNLFFVLN